ncbi:protein DPCD [Leptidea sinapis]|uniref:protein DPCD n=1 Tax=Leptidea sinapis TaxID=189913 RepID=UPI002134BFDB|nr:protein DPCD [Leptidea sinapis]
MKRKICLIDNFETCKEVFREKLNKKLSENMYMNTIWYKSLLNADKSCIKEEKIRKIHYKFDDDREMVEEYNTDTKVLLRRAWKVKGKLGCDGKWDVEVGDPIPEAVISNDCADIIESKDQPVVTRRNTRVNLEWRIRNLPYPIETYCIKANNDDKCIIVSTTNKKYYKKLQVPELKRLGLNVDQANIQSSHKFNTLIIMYKKPQQLLDMEMEWFKEVEKVKPIKDIPNECKTH